MDLDDSVLSGIGEKADSQNGNVLVIESILEKKRQKNSPFYF